MGCLLGRKIGMTQAFAEDGGQKPLTVIQAGPCKVLEQKTLDRHGYSAVVVGFEEIEGAKANRPSLGRFKKLKTAVFKTIREFRNQDVEASADLNVEQFKPGDRLEIQGVSKGKGFASAIKRWNFSRGRETHGAKFNRAIGGTGGCEFPGRVFKGKKMPGHMGTDKVKLKNVEVVDVIPEENLLVVKGPIPGGHNGLLKIESQRPLAQKKQGALRKGPGKGGK